MGRREDKDHHEEKAKEKTKDEEEKISSFSFSVYFSCSGNLSSSSPSNCRPVQRSKVGEKATRGEDTR